MMAIALSCRPAVLLADEPTTALDVTVQIQILLLLRKLQREFGMAVIFVTHDVGVSVEIADRLAVMYAGRFVETGPMDAVIRAPRHPYTQGLLASSVHGSFRDHRLEAIPGMPPALSELAPGCAFAPRCRYVEDRCVAADPPEHRVAPDHAARCVRASDGSLPVFGTATATLSPPRGRGQGEGEALRRLLARLGGAAGAPDRACVAVSRCARRHQAQPPHVSKG